MTFVHEIMRFLKALNSVVVASWVKYSLAFVSLAYLYNALNKRSEFLFTDIKQLFFTQPKNTFIIISLLVILSSFNWLIEVLKWHLLINQLTINTWKQSFKESFMAHAIGIFTPNKLGDHFGKLVFHQDIKKVKIFEISFTQHFTQLLATLFFGLIGIVSMMRFISLDRFMDTQLFISTLGILIFGLIIAYFKLPNLGQKILFYLSKKSEKNANILMLSILKYIIFSHLFILLVYLLGAKISYTHLLIGAWTMYLISSVIPTFMVTDLIVKSGVAVFVFSAFQVAESIVLLSSFLMWLFNFVMPALLGNFYLLQRKTLPKKKALKV